MDVPDVAELAARDERAGLLALRVEADVEVRAVDEPASLGELEQLRRLLRVIASGFSQTTCLPASSACLRLRVVEMVRRRQMDDVDAIVGEHRLEAVVRLGQRHGPLLAAPAPARADDTGDLDAEAAQCVDVDDADEAGAHHSRTEIG